MNNKNIKSLKFRNPVREYKGFTLFTPLNSKKSYLIDMNGRVVHIWELPFMASYDMTILRNGNLLYQAKVEEGPLKEFEGSSGRLVELDWNGKVIWEYEDMYMHHSFYRLKNGNTIFLKWVKVPDDLAVKVNGGLNIPSGDITMFTDAICEVNKYGRVVYEWKAYEHLDIGKSIICPIDYKSEWTHANSIDVMSDEKSILVSFMLINTVAIINRQTGNIDWSWGPGEIAHQHCATAIENGNILIFDNGLHSAGGDFQFSRVIEVDPSKNKIVWEYTEDSLTFFYSSILGNCHRLSNGNTFVCDSENGRIFEITSEKKIVWEYVNPYFDKHNIYGYNNIVVSAHRYPVDYPAFKKKNWII